MRVAMFLLCLMVYCVSTSGLIPSGGDMICQPHRSIHGQHAQFGKSVRDWFSNIKARILTGRGTNPKLEDPNKLEQEKCIMIDLNTLKFNPQKDWGFKVGYWYYIKHEDENTDKAILSGGSNYDDLYELYDESKEGVEYLSAENGGEGEAELTTPRPLEPNEPDEISIPTETAAPNNVGKRNDENNIAGPQSAEVLTPIIG